VFDDWSALPVCLPCRSVVGQCTSYGVSYDAISNQWLVSPVAVPSHQSPGFHFMSQLLDQIDIGLKMASVDIHSVATQFPLHGMSYTALCTYCSCEDCNKKLQYSYYRLMEAFHKTYETLYYFFFFYKIIKRKGDF